MPDPLVSVKMITYNHAPFIAQAIEGVLRQRTSFPFELVIGEDCSTDGTREIVFEYQKKRPDIIRVITSSKNVGMKKNGWRTTNACSGKYLAFCEGDDYWHDPDKLQKQADHLESHQECGLVYSSYDIYHVKTGEIIKDFIKYRRWEIPEDAGISHIIKGPGAPLTCTVMVRRKLFEQIRDSDPFLHQSEHFLMGDTQIWAEISTRARLHYIPESLATHVITEESATRSRDIKKVLRFQISNTEMLLYLCNKYGLPRQMKDRLETFYEDYRLHLAFHARNKELADDVRGKSKTFTFMDWLLYYGARNSMLYYSFRLAASVRKLLRKADSQWA